VFGLAVRRGIVTRNPVDGLTPAERPKQRNARNVERLDSATIRKLVAAASTERWKAAFALAGLGGLRLGEVRGLQWGDIDLEANTITVSRSLLPNGTPTPPKTDAGVRVVPCSPTCGNRSSRGSSEARSPIQTTTCW
jgi:integrase